MLVHVLFMDIIGSTKYFTDEQRGMVEDLQNKVRATEEYRKGFEKQELITLGTGDGVALIFLQDVEAPLRCAIELSRALREQELFRVRMGINSGPVFIVDDINGQKNASGSGINRAQRVMDCGDDNHILLSEASADVLRQLRRWSNGLHDIGECKVKDGWYHVWSYFDEKDGNPALPKKSKRRMQRRRMLAISALGVCGIAASAKLLYRPAVPVPAPERSLTYSLLVKPPKGSVRSVAREMIFPPHYGLKLKFEAAQPGFLYLLNRGPDTGNGNTWHWLFPYPAFHNGAGAVSGGDSITLPGNEDSFYELDEKSGKETILVIWSNATVPELDAVKSEVFKRSVDGKLTRDQAASVARFLEEHRMQVSVTREENGTRISSQNSLLVQPITLEHL